MDLIKVQLPMDIQNLADVNLAHDIEPMITRLTRIHSQDPDSDHTNARPSYNPFDIVKTKSYRL